MSAQILLQGKLLGGEEFLLAPPADRDNRLFEARSMWLALMSEVVPRALLAELQRRRAQLVHLTTRQASLEDVFVQLTGRHLRED